MTKVDAEERQSSAPPRTRAVLILAVISLAQLMITLDSTIVSVALPSIQDDVGLSDASRQWAVTAYTLAFGGLLLLSGRLSDLMGRRRAMLVGVAGFAVASALGGAADDEGTLIAARALQGVFAALIAPSTLAMINTIFVEPKERARAFSIYSATAMSGGALGLVLGGVLTDYLGWRWCLYVNVPIALFVLLGGWTSVPGVPRQREARLDVPGALLSSLGMLALIYGLGEAGERGWDSAAIVGALVLAVVLLVGFVTLQARRAHPLLPLGVLTNRNSGASFLAMGVAAFCTYGMLLGMTYQLQTVMGYSPLRTGLAFMAYVLTAVVYSTQIATRLVLRVRPGLLVASGLGLFGVALLLLTRLTPESSYLTDILPTLVLFGVGVGNMTVPAITTAMTVTDARNSGIVSAVVSTSQQVSGSIGAALLNTISIGAAAGYLASRPDGPDASTNATVHGFVVASVTSAVVAVVGALVVLVAINVDTRPRR